MHATRLSIDARTEALAALQAIRHAEAASAVEHSTWTHDGFPAHQRDSVRAYLDYRHTRFVSTVSRLAEDQFIENVPVIFVGAVGESSTSPEDVVGWMRSHYCEPVVQIGTLLTRWRSSRP